MFVANPIDPTLSPIRFVGTPGPSVPVRRVATAPAAASYRTQRGHVVTVAGLVLAAAIAGFGAGHAAGRTSPVDAGVGRIETGPLPGEFRLAPGLGTPPGIVVALD